MKLGEEKYSLLVWCSCETSGRINRIESCLFFPGAAREARAEVDVGCAAQFLPGIYVDFGRLEGEENGRRVGE